MKKLGICKCGCYCLGAYCDKCRKLDEDKKITARLLKKMNKQIKYVKSVVTLYNNKEVE